MAVFNGSKILIWKQITTFYCYETIFYCCIQWFKDTNLKANHNLYWIVYFRWMAVFNGSKILIWKQITTTDASGLSVVCCIQWFKDTNLKANHNCMMLNLLVIVAVFNGSKILIWKQITTGLITFPVLVMLYSMVQRY